MKSLFMCMLLHLGFLREGGWSDGCACASQGCEARARLTAAQQLRLQPRAHVVPLIHVDG
jgi:hypothetical protein